MPTTRRATIIDTQRIAQIHVAGWQTAYRGIVPDAILDALKPDDRQTQWDQRMRDNYGDLLVCTSGNRIMGFCHLMPSRDANAGDAHEIAALYIDPAAWRQGCGRALCQDALTAAREHGAPTVTLWVLAQNAAGRRFYEAIGFAPDGATKTEKRPEFSLEELRYRIDIRETA